MPRIAFMGTPEFAAPILKSLADTHEVIAVYTRADKPAGRGKTLTEAPVKIVARTRGLNIEQPRTWRHAEIQAQLRAYRPDLIVVAAYGLILPPAVLEIPPRGCINVHASLLPRWRGASPIAFALLAGAVQTGVTLMQMDAGVDTGPLLAQRALPIARDDTTATLTEKLARLGAQLLIATLPAWFDGKITPTPQNNADATLTRLVAKEDGLIDWRKPARELERAVRAYNPWPSAYTFLPPSPIGARGALLKVWRAGVADDVVSEPPGTVVRIGDAIGVSTSTGVLILRAVQLAGKRAMTIEEFVRGQRDFVGARLVGRRPP